MASKSTLHLMFNDRWLALKTKEGERFLLKHKRFVLRSIVLGVIVIALGGAFYTYFTSDDSIVKAGEPAPDFSLKNLEGQEVRLSDLKGKGVVINFWATWCAPCKREMPLMESGYQKVREQGIEILAVNIAESDLAVSRFTERLGLTFPILLDKDRTVTRRYAVGRIPSTFFVDQDGIVVAHFVGEMNARIFEENMNLLIPTSGSSQ